MMLTKEKRAECFNELLESLHGEIYKRIMERKAFNEDDATADSVIEDLDASGIGIFDELIAYVGYRYFGGYLSDENRFKVIENE